MAALNVGVLISGRGTNLQALLDACADPAFPADISIVVSNVPGAPGLERAQAGGVAIEIVNHKDFDDRARFETALTGVLEVAGVSFVCLAGFMRLLTPTFVDHWFDRLINIHPSLLPAFPGLHTHHRAIEAGVRFGGCTVHYVRSEMDSGPIIVQAAVPIAPDDNADSLAARVLDAEHICYPSALKLIAGKYARVTGDVVEISDARSPENALINPKP